MLVAISAIGVGALYWRLSQGPVSLGFMQNAVENAVNKQLQGFKISLGEAVLELDSETKTPNVRARNLVLKDEEGLVLAAAPKAGVALDRTQLLRGTVVVTSIELIGPRINARRNLDGTIQLGIDGTAADSEQETVLNDNDIVDEQRNYTSPPPQNVPAGSSRLLKLLSAKDGKSALANLDDIRITRATINLFDEANASTWFSPRSDMSFKRTEAGFVVLTKSTVASGGAPWTVELTASYKSSAENFAIAAAVSDLVPANVADEIYGLSQFAKLKMPFHGNFEMNVTSAGRLTDFTGQLRAAAGEINFPDYLAKAVQIEQGTFNLAYKADEDIVNIQNSTLTVAGADVAMTGKLKPNRLDDGRLQSLFVDIDAQNAKGVASKSNGIDIDRITFSGEVAMEEQKVAINDLVVMAGNTGVRLRGRVSAGEQSPGIQVAGRLRDVSADLLKKLWPPILTPRTRTWINDNVVSGTITSGTFQVNFAENVLAKAIKAEQLPKNVVDVTFDMSNVTTRYFKNLPPLKKANGSASLRDGAFTMDLTSGQSTLETGQTVQLSKGKFVATQLLKQEVLGAFDFDINGPLDNMLAFAAHPDLKFSPPDGATPKLKGTAFANIGLQLPLVKGVAKERVKVTTKLRIEDAALPEAAPGVDLSDGKFAVELNAEEILVSGPAKLNGVASELSWTKPRGKGEAEIAIKTVATAKMREKLGLNLEDYISGDVPVNVKINGPANSRVVDVKADLDDVAMKLSAVGWSRGKTKGSNATFKFKTREGGTKSIEELRVDGPAIKLRGEIELSKSNQIRSVRMSEIKVNDDDGFSANLVPGDGVMNLEVTGKNFDARPYIKQLISPAKAPAGPAPKGQNFIVSANFKTVTAHRGEVIRNVKASFVTQRGTITSANIAGTFDNALPITIKLTPVEGARELRVTSSDGGSTLRATDFYSKIAGGEMQFYALIANAPGAPIRNGQLLLRRFEVRDEATLAELDKRGRPKKSGPRRGGVYFKRLTLPFTTDTKFVRVCDVELKGDELGGVAEGLIRKADGAIDITGTMIPAQGINGFLDDVPLLGALLTGGKGEGVFGITFAMSGTISKPKTQVNPLSILAPGFLRKAFEYRGTCGNKKAAQQQRNSANN